MMPHRYSNDIYLPKSSKKFTLIKNWSLTALQGIFLPGWDRLCYHVNALFQEDVASSSGSLQIPTECTHMRREAAGSTVRRSTAHNLEKATCAWVTAIETARQGRQTQ